MQRVLRKGASSVYLQYDDVGDSIGADNFVVTVRNHAVILSFNLRPVDSNQKSDEERLHSEELREIHLSDNYVIENLSSFLSSPNMAVQELVVEIASCGKVLHFPIAIGPAGLGVLPLVVQRQAS
ncbi:hypothetical protein [Rhodanobacter sp. DHG33]|uniref:hypothetical protein n=1 Tax=Rhodanobacter sp. DHG33 TaxID=2775921 RepID=UPI00177C2E4F|nr:hypothetical protein [Rhodanobacter sp. DHG33]MBD8898379.1 hypothetical protein [Rhodanobacter sp. DHG33]